ncbi:MAG: hypothetical protein K9L17_01300 [Clostridiales bacterium]|nr:hypothetical protein [Clostridiales bacterium]MCF8021327.1 hypothetical protein [Clostridiales bacterium]
MAKNETNPRDIETLVATVKKDLIWLFISAVISVGIASIANIFISIK